MKKTLINFKAVKNFSRQLLMELLGSILIAAGIYNFALQAEFPMTGFSGISIILYQLFHIPIGLSTILLNIPIALFCYKLLGRKFFISSLRCMVISSLIIDYIAPLFPVYEGSRLLAALCTGVIAGMGYSIIYMQNSSTGGSDFNRRDFIPGYRRYHLRHDCKLSLCRGGRQSNVRHERRKNGTDCHPARKIYL